VKIGKRRKFRPYENKIGQVWFTSDTHFGHRGILNFMERPFTNLEEHDRWMIDSWNYYIKPKDVVFHLGDLSFLKADETTKILKQLQGHKHLIFGNHDKWYTPTQHIRFFDSVGFYEEIMVWNGSENEYQHIVLNHFPYETWHQRHRGSWHLHGHCHGTLPKDEGQLRQDVGLDTEEAMLFPMSFDQLRGIMKTRTIRPVDSHERREDDDSQISQEQ